MRLAAASLAVVAAVAAPSAEAAVILGVHGNAACFQAQAAQVSEVRHAFVSFAQGAARWS